MSLVGEGTRRRFASTLVSCGLLCVCLSAALAATPDCGASRVVSTTTALPNPEGSLTWKALGLGHWSADYAVTDELDVGGQVTFPIMVFSIGPHVRWTHALDEVIHIGFDVRANFAVGFGSLTGMRVLQGGGGPVATFGPRSVNVTLSFPVHWFGLNDYSFWLAAPSVGLSAEAGSSVTILAEFYAPFGGDDDGPLWGTDDGLNALLVYGIRIRGSAVYGEFAFAIPWRDGEWMVYKQFPLGWPIVSLGFVS